MPLKLNVGASRKVTDHNYGSRGASVNLELELDSDLIADTARLQEKIRQLFGLVRTSLAEELNGGGNGHSAKEAPSPQGQPRPGQASNVADGSSPTRTNGQRLATASQVKAIYAIARSQALEVASFLQQRFQVRRPDDLTLKQASLVIDELKASA